MSEGANRFSPGDRAQCSKVGVEFSGPESLLSGHFLQRLPDYIVTLKGLSLRLLVMKVFSGCCGRIPMASANSFWLSPSRRIQAPDLQVGRVLFHSSEYLWSFCPILCSVLATRLPFDPGRDLVTLGSESSRFELYSYVVGLGWITSVTVPFTQSWGSKSVAFLFSPFRIFLWLHCFPSL